MESLISLDGKLSNTEYLPKCIISQVYLTLMIGHLPPLT